MPPNSAVPSTGVELVRAGRNSPIRPMPLHEVTRAMSEYQDGLAAILDDSDWQTFSTNGGDDRRFVKRTGWRKIATWYGLDLLVDADKVTIDRDDNGVPLRARVIARVVAPNGRMAEDVGACSADERRFTKLEHDLVSTATTRALNRATANLVGMGSVSAEEIAVDADVDVAPMLPSWAQAPDAETMEQFTTTLRDFVGETMALALIEGTERAYGHVPSAVAKSLINVHAVITNPPTPAADEPWNDDNANNKE